MSLFLKFLRNTIKIKFGPKNRFYNDVAFEDIPEVSPALIKRTLKANNFNFEEGFTCFVTFCPNCKFIKSNSRNVYINKATGMFMCSFCKQNGQWNEFEIKLTNRKNKNKSDEISEVALAQKIDFEGKIKQIRESTEKIRGFNENLYQEIFKNFKLTPIRNDLLQNFDVRIDKSKDNLYFPLENVQNEVVGYKKLNRQSSTEETLPSGNFGGLLTGRPPQKYKDIAILVPNVIDFLILFNLKTNGCVVCLPNGLNNLPLFVLPSLERYKKLIFWFGDDDLKSWDSARQFAKKLGEKRCLFIRPSEKQLLSNLEQNQDVKAILNGAQPIWHKSITTFSSLRQDVYSDLKNIDKVQGIKWKRFPTLNKILKGHRRGELTVITGPTGSGKTTFISEYSLDLAIQGVNTLWGSFEIRNARLARTMLQQFCGISLEENLQFFDQFADQFEKLPIYFMTFHGQQTVKVVMEAVEHATYVHDIAHVIIDNVQFMMGITEEHKHMDRFWKQDAIVAAFRSFATRKNCHVSLVIHPRKERDDEDLTTSSIFGGAKASQEADNVLIIQDKRLTSVRGKKYLQVAKNRYSGDLGVMALDFDKLSLSYAQKKIKKNQEISENQEIKK